MLSDATRVSQATSRDQINNIGFFQCQSTTNTDEVIEHFDRKPFEGLIKRFCPSLLLLYSKSNAIFFQLNQKKFVQIRFIQIDVEHCGFVSKLKRREKKHL